MTIREAVVFKWQQEVVNASQEETNAYWQLMLVPNASPEARKQYHQVLQYRDLVIMVMRGLQDALLYPTNQPRRAAS